MTRRLRELGRWVADWRTGVTLLAACLVGLLVAVVVVFGVNAHDAISARDQTEETNRELVGQVAKLNAHADENSRLIGEERAQLEALQEQVRQLGAKPVVITVTTPTTAAPRPTAPAAPTTTTTVQSGPTTSTTTPPRCAVLCLPVNARHSAVPAANNSQEAPS